MKILISGGGIAGLTLAYWLHRHGFEPVVIERANGLRRDGYGVDFYSTGYDVAERMGLIDRLRSRQIKASFLAFVDESGQPTAQLDLDDLRQALDGNYMGLMHYTLEEVLYDAVKEAVEIRFNSSIKQIEQSPAEVAVTFEDGRTETWDLVVGADGIHSNVRRLLFGPEEEFGRYLGYYTAAYKIPDRYDLPPGWLNYAEPGRQMGLYPSDQPGELTTLFIFEAEDQGYIPHDQRSAKLVSAYEGMGWLTARVLADMAEPADIFMDTVTQIVMPCWSQDRVVLIGDASGCMTLISGQGVSMAMGGAYILAEELSRFSDYRTAFLNFEHRLRPHIELRQQKAHDFAKSLVPGSELGLTTQKVLMKILFNHAFRSLLRTQFLGESILNDNALQRLPESAGNVIGYKIAGKLTDADYKTFTLDVEQQLTQADDVRLLLKTDDIEGFELKALWDDLKFGLDHGQDIAKLAVVGDERWAGLVTTLSKPFYARRARRFPEAELEQAWAWLRQDNDTE